MLIDPIVRTVHTLAPGARPVSLDVPQVAGAVFLGMEAAGMPYGSIFETLKQELRHARP